MKKILILAVAAVLLALGAVAIASANAGPHGSYTPDTDKCAACHRPHTASQAYLLAYGTTEYAFCKACHNGVKASTNPFDSTYATLTPAAGRLNGGGFESVNGAPVTSIHRVAGAPVLGGGGTTYDGEAIAYGGATSGVGIAGELECTSCHNPHGSTNYRLLRDGKNGHSASSNYWGDGTAASPFDPNGADVSVKYAYNQVLDTADEPGVSEQRYAVAVNNPAASDPSKLANTWFTTGMVSFCATCHKSYLTGQGAYKVPSTSTEINSRYGTPYYYYPGQQDSNDGQSNITRFRHATSFADTHASWANVGGTAQPLRMAAYDPSYTTRSGMNCLTCHYAHGSAAAATGYAAGVQPTNDSALLYYDNRGVCQSCHNKS